jgi:TRAP transporter TAXI family solute receptor
MRLHKYLIAFVACQFFTAHAWAQNVELGSTMRGGTSQIGKAVSATVSKNSNLRMQPKEMANTADYLPLVARGALEFGVANVVQTWFAYVGKGMSKGHPLRKLRLAAILMPIRTGLIVAKQSGINAIADLKGKRLPSFKPATLGDHVIRAFLADGNLTLNDVVHTSFPNFPRMWSSFNRQRIDATIALFGSHKVREMDLATDGGVRFLSFRSSSLGAMQKWMPGAKLVELSPGPNSIGIERKTTLMTFSYVLFTSQKINDALVYKVVKNLYHSEKSLLTRGPVWRGFRADKMANNTDIPFHPGAVKFYREIGIWNK